MCQNKKDKDLGRFISLVLRHKPAAAGITLDKNGWADVNALLAGVRRTGHTINLDILIRIVQENDKKRYSFNEDRTKIRANQGHSVKVDVELKVKEPPAVLYHGTASRFVNDILKKGLSPRSRQHVHLSADSKTAVNVGSRHGKPVVLSVDAAAMVRDGYHFYCSENGVWLCEQVPEKYITILT